MSTTTNLGLELVDVTQDTVPFSTDKYVTKNFKAIDALNISNRLDAVENLGGNLRLYTGVYTGNGATTRTHKWQKTDFTPVTIFVWDASNTSAYVAVWNCNFDLDYTNLSVSALIYFTMGSSTAANDTRITCAYNGNFSEVTVSAPLATQIQNKSNTTYRYMIIGKRTTTTEGDEEDVMDNDT